MELENLALSSLDLNDESPAAKKSPENPTPVRRSGRIKIRPLEVVDKRETRSKKNDNKPVEWYYTNKQVTLTSPALETIFEEPDGSIMSKRKLKRQIKFDPFIGLKPDKSKMRQRKIRAKKLLQQSLDKIRKKIGLDVFLKKLKEVDSDVEA